MQSKGFSTKYIALGISFLISVMIMLCLPCISFAATGTLGDEAPELYCTYEDENGQEVDGNSLTAGTYDVSLHISGMSNISVLQVTATYTDDASVDATPLALMTDSVESVSSMGYVVGDGNIVFGFVSDNADTTAVSDDVVIATVTVSFANDCDAADVIQISENPNLTFALADYGDGYDDEYAIDTAFAGYNGELYPMTADVTPGQGKTVTGSIVVMTDQSGSTDFKAANGEYTINVYSDAERQNLLKSVNSEIIDNDLEKLNQFTIAGLANGTYYASISSDLSLTRSDITIIISDNDITDAVIPVVACDFNSDGYINISDILLAIGEASASSDNLLYDLNGDVLVNISDTLVTKSCAAGQWTADEIVIQ